MSFQHNLQPRASLFNLKTASSYAGDWCKLNPVWIILLFLITFVKKKAALSSMNDNYDDIERSMVRPLCQMMLCQKRFSGFWKHFAFRYIIRYLSSGMKRQTRFYWTYSGLIVNILVPSFTEQFLQHMSTTRLKCLDIFWNERPLEHSNSVSVFSSPTSMIWSPLFRFFMTRVYYHSMYYASVHSFHTSSYYWFKTIVAVPNKFTHCYDS